MSMKLRKYNSKKRNYPQVVEKVQLRNSNRFHVHKIQLKNLKKFYLHEVKNVSFRKVGPI